MITQWLEHFHEAWKLRDINGVMDLFTEDVEYWETPYKLLLSKTDVRAEWQAIMEQEDIDVSWQIFNTSADGRHAITWHLTYAQGQHVHKLGGVYLIQLDAEGKCNYFYYVGEEKK